MAPPQALPGFLVVGLGVQDAGGPGALPPLLRVAARLAEHLQLTPLELQADCTPDASLAALQVACSGLSRGWLAPLPVDPGMALEDGTCWAQTLGAWRQPVVLVIPAEQLASGLAAAGTALLRHWRVPLLGLLQWGGAWEVGQRRGDGLPWLGLLSSDGMTTPPPDPAGHRHEAEQGLAAALALRWQRRDR